MQFTWCAYCNDVQKWSRICKALWFNKFHIRLCCSKTCWTVIAIFPCFLLFQTETKLVRCSIYIIFSFSKNVFWTAAMPKHVIKIMPRSVLYFLPSYYLNGDLHAKETQVYRNLVNPSSPKIDILGSISPTETRSVAVFCYPSCPEELKIPRFQGDATLKFLG